MNIVCILVAVSSLVVAIPHSEFEHLCLENPTKHVVRHPTDCSSYVECFTKNPIVRSCGTGLHYNIRKGVCDYPEFSHCQDGPWDGITGPTFDLDINYRPLLTQPSPTHFLPPTLGPTIRSSVRPLRRQFRGSRRRRPNQVSYRATYEETVYGSSSRTYIDNELRSYATVLMKNAKRHVKDRMANEIHVYKEMYDIIDSGPFRMVSKFLNARPYTKRISQSGIAILAIMKSMMKRFGDSSAMQKAIKSAGINDILKPLPGVYEPDTPMVIPPDIDYCPYPRRMNCHGNSLKFRTVDGTCNNLNNPIWGRSMTPFSRMVPHRYADGVEEMRRSKSGHPLPGARHVSFRLFPDADIPQQTNNMMMVFWGQLIDHDLTLTAITEVPTDETLNDTQELKCGVDGCKADGPGLDACWPIPVPHDDSDFPYNRCLKFVRSAEVPQLNCETGAREQMNQATHWLDSSMVYGVTKEDSYKVRDLSNRSRGRMALRRHPAGGFQHGRVKDVLPTEVDGVCRDVNNTHSCFLAGDERVNENAGLTVYHTSLIREHNRIELALHRINPHWDGERLYQEVRRILAAMVQHIVYNEWLPLIVGSEVTRELDLNLKPTGYYRGYNSAHDPRIANEFAAAAFRFGHTLLEEKVRRMDAEDNVNDDLFLSETFFRPVHTYSLEHGGLDSIARGLANLPCQAYDQFFTKQITRHLFTERPPFGPSMDLVSLNIQRGRDHGIGTYNDFRHLCGLGRAKNFHHLAGEIRDERALNALINIYNDVADIDLFAGGVSERPVPGGQVGPTFACIIGRTFRELRRGDRFWYENDNDVGFTPEQLQEIRKTTASRILCANMDNMKQIQKWLFMMPREIFNDNIPFHSDSTHFADFLNGQYVANPKLHCDHLADPDLSLWKERGRY